jgi:hypothetical protein
LAETAAPGPRALRFEESSKLTTAKCLAPAGTPLTAKLSFAPGACGAGSSLRLAAIYQLVTLGSGLSFQAFRKSS